MFFVFIFKVRIDSVNYNDALFSRFAVTLQFVAFSFFYYIEYELRANVIMWHRLFLYKLFE